MIKKIIIYLILVFNIFCLPVYSQVIDISSAKNDQTNIKPLVEIYRPSKLIIGAKNKFIIKGEPGTNIILAFSPDNKGAEPYYGQDLRLGIIIDKVEDVIRENGISKINLELPERKDLVGATVYFDAIVWKQEDLSDITKAKIIGSNGMESNYNAILIGKKPGKNSFPLIGPGMGGIGVSRAMEALSGQESSNKEHLYTDDVYYKTKPLMLRNLRAPEVKQNQETKQTNE